ncbi:TetR/AcrR family transcriptional regulator [Nonomuraea dietziae]|uniref:TetR/AcrR family transcriptional regulator n=1 Tax=Nonomuraea dietziae TaxID=65515 RepID=UPI0033C2F368
MKRSETVAEAAITLLAERGMRGLTHRAVDELAGLPPGSTSNLARTRAALLELTLLRLTELEEHAFAPAIEAGGFPAPGATVETDGPRRAGAAPAVGASPPAKAAERSGGLPSAGAAEGAGGFSPAGAAEGGGGFSPAEAAQGGGGVRAMGLGELVGLMAEVLVAQLSDRRRTLARYELALEATRRPELREIYDRVGARFREPAVALLAAAGSQDPVRHGRQLVAYGEGIMFDAIAGAGVTPSIEDLTAGLTEFLSGMLR